MPIEIRMPALSPTMEEGTLAKWLVKVGDAIKSGDVIAEIETDKATMEVESIDDGVVGKLLIGEGGEPVKVGTLIALVLGEGEDKAALATVKAEAAPPTKPDAALAPAVKPQPAAAIEHDGDRIKASPLARRIAGQQGVDLGKVTGSGPHGRIVKRDVEGLEATPKATAAEPATPAKPAAAADSISAPDIPHEEIKLSSMRKTIAKRLTLSKQTVPHFYLSTDCELDTLLGLRGELNKKLEKQGVKLSVNDFIIRAMASALKKVPMANVQYAGDKMFRFTRIDVSVAVAIDGGLITPVIKDAGSKGLAEISTEMKALAAKARDGKLAPEEFQGGTISLSNLGMFGVKAFDAVINPPQAAILAIGAGEQRAVVKNGALAIATVMTATLSCDHRAIDGAVGAEFLAAFKGFIEDPLAMLL